MPGPSDNLALKKVEIIIDGGDPILVSGVNVDTPLNWAVENWSHDYPTYALPNGSHTIEVLVTDYRNRTTLSAPRVITTDNEVGILGANGFGGCITGVGNPSFLLLVAGALLALRGRRKQ